VPLLSVSKLKHDIEQFSYLRGLGILANDLTQVIDGYRILLERIKPLGDSGGVELGDADREQIGHVYSRLVHRRPTPRVNDRFDLK
jgi:hypothetical protein